MKYRDYYEILGVPRTATAEEIRRAYRMLARKHHPDANKGQAASEEKFKEINEAYEVLKDPEKRVQYDSLGANWKSGQEFRPPPGAQGFPGGGQGFNFGDFSDFFEAVFGARGGSRTQQGSPYATGHPGFGPQQEALEAEVEVPLDTILTGGKLTLTLQIPGRGNHTYEIRVPKGIGEGKKIRLAGEGPNGADLLLKVRYGRGTQFRLENGQLTTDVRVSPAVAALGGRATVHTVDGPVSLRIPPGSSSGRRIRLRGKGLPASGGEAGDLFAQVMVEVPEALTEAQRRLYEALAELEG